MIYTNPEMEIKKFAEENVVTASVGLVVDPEDANVGSESGDDIFD